MVGFWRYIILCIVHLQKLKNSGGSLKIPVPIINLDSYKINILYMQNNKKLKVRLYNACVIWETPVIPVTGAIFILFIVTDRVNH